MAIARATGIGAIKYPMLARENTKIVTFDWEAALDFNGQAAPYIQYAYVRASSILRKSGGVVPRKSRSIMICHRPKSSLLIGSRACPNEVQRAAVELKPLYIASLAFELAQRFYRFLQ